jgi:hypothetical protein
MSTIIAPKLVFISHRWPLALDSAGRVGEQASRPVIWPGGLAKLAVASNDPSRRFPGTALALQAEVGDVWRTLLVMREPGSYEVSVPAGPVRLVAEGGARSLLITCTANWYPPAERTGETGIDLGLVA